MNKNHEESKRGRWNVSPQSIDPLGSVGFSFFASDVWQVGGCVRHCKGTRQPTRYVVDVYGG